MAKYNDPEQFGVQLLETGDLDPVYLALYGAHVDGKISSAQLKRLCLTYWCYYHLGVAALVSEHSGASYWYQMLSGLRDFPRGTERRHFRGDRAVEAVTKLSIRFPQPEGMIAYLTTRGKSGPAAPRALLASVGGKSRVTSPSPASDAPRALERVPGGKVNTLSFREVSERAQALPMFGPWIAFKVADMLERVLLIPVDFSDCQLLQFYSEPRHGATLAARRWGLPTPEDALAVLLSKLQRAKRRAPPAFDRIVNVQEAETVLCKWKSHLNGHYEIGKDVHEVSEGLEAHPSTTGKMLLKMLEERTKIKPRQQVLIKLDTSDQRSRD